VLSLDALNAPQREAVLHERGPLVVFAGAGSGKTRVITYRIAHLVGEREERPWRVLAVTFTNKAAGEMRERLGKLLPQGGADVWVGTFHATCAKLLRKHAAEIGIKSSFAIYDEADSKAMVARVLRDLDIDERRYPPKLVAGAIERAKQEARGPDDFKVFDAETEVIKRIYATYEERMRQSGALDFGDLLFRLVYAMQTNDKLLATLQQRFDHVLVDEFQDTNHVQLRLVHDLCMQHRSLVVVGDDDQSIYRWRGANRRNILDFRDQFPDATVIKLEQNYRSTARILRAAQSVVQRNLEREPKTLWTSNPDGARVTVVRCHDERDEARLAVRAVRDAAQAGHALSDIAIFYRIHAQSRVFEEALRAANIPYRVVGGVRFYDRAEVKDVLAYLRVLENPDDDVSVLRVVNTPSRGIGKATIDRLLDTAATRGISVAEALRVLRDADDQPAALRKKLESFLGLVDSLRERASQGEAPSALARAVLDETGYKQMLETDDTPESDARLENLEELVGSIVDFEEEAEEPTLRAFLEIVTLQTDVDEVAAGDRLTLMTVHAAKGLEFDTVIVAGLEEEMFPYRGLDPGSDREELEEERRLAYVAFTRARERLVLMHASLRHLFGQTRINARSRFIDEIPPDDRHEIGVPPPRASAPPPPRDVYPERDEPAWDENPYRVTYRNAKTSERASGESYVDREDTDLAGLRLGMRVRHAKFGIGQVRAVTEGHPPRVTVTFPGWGTKQIVAKFLEPA